MIIGSETEGLTEQEEEGGEAGMQRNALHFIIFFPMARQPLGGPRPPHFSRLHDHTFRHTTLNRTPLDE
jgi:hypothetical protein